MRVAIGFIGANLLFVTAGIGILASIGVVRPHAADLARATGLALIVGMSFVMLVGIAMLVVGIPVRFLTLAAVCIAAGGGGLAIAQRRLAWFQLRADKPKPRPSTWTTTSAWRDALVQRLAVLAALIALIVFVAVAFSYYKVIPAATFDEFAIWSKKALALYYFDDLDPRFFVNSTYLPMHQEYPILLPLVEAFVFRAMGRPDTQLIHVEFLVVFASFLGAVAYLTYRESRNVLWGPAVLALAVAPFVHAQLVTGYADIPMSCLVALGVLSLGFWLDRGEHWRLILAVLFLGAAGNTKFEGLIAATLAFVAVAAILAVQRRWRPLGAGGIGFAAFIALLLPWRIWVAAHPEIHSFFSLGKGLDPHYLSQHTDLPREAITLLSANLADAGQSLYLVPAALAFAMVCLVVGRTRPVAAFYLLLSTLLVAALVWVYWVDPTTWSPNRVVDSIILIGVVAILQLSTYVRLPSSVARPFAGPPREIGQTGDEPGLRVSRGS